MRSLGYDLVPLRNAGFEEQKEKLGREAEVIIDAGAGVGRTAKIYRQLFPLARIFALEPHPDSFRVLSRELRSDPL